MRALHFHVIYWRLGMLRRFSAKQIDPHRHITGEVSNWRQSRWHILALPTCKVSNLTVTNHKVRDRWMLYPTGIAPKRAQRYTSLPWRRGDHSNTCHQDSQWYVCLWVPDCRRTQQKHCSRRHWQLQQKLLAASDIGFIYNLGGLEPSPLLLQLLFGLL
jgi:hypothetical protein